MFCAFKQSSLLGKRGVENIKLWALKSFCTDFTLNMSDHSLLKVKGEG